MQPDGTRFLVRDGLSLEKTMATTMTELESSHLGSPAPSSVAVDDGYSGERDGEGSDAETRRNDKHLWAGHDQLVM